MGAVKKEDIAMALAEKYEITKRDGREYVDFVIKSIEDSLVSGQTVDFAGFAKFDTVIRPAHQAKNPATGEILQIPQTRKLKVTVKKAFKEALAKA